jgi:hypothetical protein
MDPSEVIQLAEEALREVRAALFGPEGRDPRSTLAIPSLNPARVTIFLFHSHTTIEKAFGIKCEACALPAMNTVALPHRRSLSLPELLRHEITHLFVLRPWNRLTPPLLSEGLPTWIQQTVRGSSVDRLAANSIGPRKGALRPLLTPQGFYHQGREPNSAALAGSFTGFLIRRFGRASYLRFYSAMYDGQNFDAKFAAHFGHTFEVAEKTWRFQVVWENDQPLNAHTAG